ncbi:cytochrome P450 [Dactylosporangium sp. NPDC050688]|uniref:cytochrome P450 n=1 Tax=Dactylosporangium sp. NPDC050688 TaxID=3157217 RepID=UPI0033F127B5
MPRLDNSLPLALDGYAWLPDRRRRAGGPFATRLAGLPATGIAGPDAVRFFYDEEHVLRHGAIPEPVQGTLFGHGAVHTLDGDAHRHRKAVFLSLLGPDGAAALAEETAAVWDRTAAGWARREIVLFDEASRVITEAACRWAGVDGTLPAGDLVALVDGFATLGPRHWRARRARGRLERRLAGQIEAVRNGMTAAPAGSAVAVVAAHRDLDGALLPPRTAAVEVLNVIRPTVAVCWFVAYMAHAMHLWPHTRMRLRAGDPAYVEAFVHETRRFYPFAPFVGGRAARDLTWRGTRIPAGSMVLLDLYGQNHDRILWEGPYQFRPERFLKLPPGRDDLVPQGGGNPATGHRCPGEGATISLLSALAPRLAALDWTLPPQDLTISLRRIPARPRSGVVLAVPAVDRTMVG